MFDKEHRYAAMNFSFVCGGLCAHGAILVFEKRMEMEGVETAMQFVDFVIRECVA